MTNFKKLLLFITFSILVIMTVVLAVLVNDITLKIITIVSGLVLIVLVTVLMNYLQHRNTKDEKYEPNNKRCPKCYHPFDGEVCFYCGYKKGDTK